MGKTIIAEPTWLNDSALVASEEATGFNSWNLELIQPTDRWRSVNATGVKTLTATLPASGLAGMNYAGLFFHNGTATGGWRIQVYDEVPNLLWDSSRYGQVIYLDAPDQDGVSSDPAWNRGATTPWTWEAWLNPAYQRKEGILKFGSSWYLGHEADGRVRFWDENEPVSNFNLYSTSTLTRNGWTHVAITCDAAGGGAATVRLVINGVTEASSTTVTTEALGSTVNMPCQYPGETDAWYTGGYDEVRVWDSARSDATIVSQLGDVIQSPYTGLEAYFKMTEGSGNTTTSVVGGIDWDWRGGAAEGVWTYRDLMRSRPGLVGWDSYHAHIFIPGGATANQVVASILDERNTAGYFEAGRFYVSDAWRGETGGRRFGDNMGPTDVSNRSQLPGGETTSVPRGSKPGSRFIVVLTDEYEMVGGPLRIARVRAGKDCMVLHDLDDKPGLAQEKTHYGFLSSRTQYTTLAGGVYEVPMQVEGII